MKNMISPLGRSLINHFQGGFPLSERPYSQVAAKLGTTETTLILILEELLEQGLLSRFGPLYDATRLGGGLTLAAMAVPEPLFETVAEEVNQLPEVAHNYRREHALNMWFVVATETRDALPKVLRLIEHITGLRVYNFPKQQEFYLGLWLRLEQDGRIDTVSMERASEPHAAASELPVRDAVDRRVITATQTGLPLCAMPYAEIADQLGMQPAELTERLGRMLESGVIRRIGAVPNHYRLGLRGNGMTVWDIPDDRAATLGRRIGKLDFVSHCYLRPRHPGVWPYNLFAMVHGRDRQEVLAKAGQLASLLDGECRAHDVLFSSAVLKKTGLRLAA